MAEEKFIQAAQIFFAGAFPFLSLLLIHYKEKYMEKFVQYMLIGEMVIQNISCHIVYAEVQQFLIP